MPAPTAPGFTRFRSPTRRVRWLSTSGAAWQASSWRCRGRARPAGGHRPRAGNRAAATVDAEPAAKKTITITGSNIVDGSVKYQDLNKASIQKGIYLKAQTDRLFLKLSDADARLHKVITNALGGYIKLGDADTRYLKLDALNGYLKLTDADARFLKHGALDSYPKFETLDGFLKLDALNGYLKLDALNGYLKLDALNGYLKLTDADGRFVKVEDVDTRIDKHLTDNGYLKLTDADGRFLKLADAGALIDKHLSDASRGLRQGWRQRRDRLAGSSRTRRSRC